MTNKKLVILAALNGGAQYDREGAIVPCSPAELAEDAAQCYEAGAAAIHFHARDANKQATTDIKVFGEVIASIREKCPVLIQTTNGMGIRRDPNTGKLSWPTDEERLALLKVQPKQDLFSLACSSWDFYCPAGGYPGEVTFVNTTDLLRKNIPAVIATGAPIEFEIVEVSTLYKLRRLAEEGVFDANSNKFWLDFGFGFGAAAPTARTLVHTLDEGQRLFPKARWEILATGRDQFWMNTLGVALGCDIARVGFEDNIYLPNGRAAQHNYQLVETMVCIAREFGREPASVEEAKAVFGIT